MNNHGDGQFPIVSSHTSSISCDASNPMGHRILLWSSIVGSLIFATLIALELVKGLPESTAYGKPVEKLVSH